MPKKKRKKIELSIEAIANEGVAIGRIDGAVHFVKYAVPGDEIIAEVIKKKRSYFISNLLEIKTPSIDRIEPKCKYFGVCGGCSWQNLDYEKQLFWKYTNVIDAFERIGRVEVGKFHDIMPAQEIFNYRNKMEFSFGWSRWMTVEEIQSDLEIENKNFALGMHIPGRFDKVLDLEECHIHPEIGNKLINIIRQKALELDVPAYNQIKHTGFLRNLVIRRGLANNDNMCILITATADNDNEKEFIRWFKDEFEKEMPEFNEIIYAINDTKSPVASGDSEIIKGRGYFIEKILGIEFTVSPFSFFQTNSSQLDNFIKLILDTADLKQNDNVWDLYCGAGSITLPASKHCKNIFGIELVESAIGDAKENAERNNIQNAEFYCADLHSKDAPNLLAELPKPDVIIADPPRAGIHKNLLNTIINYMPDKIVYVSCNPSTQARDCNVLAEIYDIISVAPVDMFPHTFHIESVALLKKKENSNA